MVYLVEQILLCLILAALIGGIVGWLLRQLRGRAEEQMLRRAVDEKNQSLRVAKGKAASLEADLADAHRRLESKTRRLESRIQELLPFPDIVRRREATISRLQNELRLADAESQTRLASAEEGPCEPASTSEDERPTPVPEGHDDLKRIKGIGPVRERILFGLGITTYRQIAAFSQQDIERVAAAIDTFPNRILRDDWIGGAEREYAKRCGRATVQTVD